MTQPDPIEQLVSDWLIEAAKPRTPDYFADILALTARTRQRSAWRAPERWFPMTVVARQPVVIRPAPWWTLGLVALLAVLLAGALLAAGARPRLPAPFGRAANGSIAYDSGGDIYTLDPATGVTRAVVTGPATDVRPRWSRDGSHLVFERKLAGDTGPGQLYVAAADGTNATLITPTPLAILQDDEDSYSFSPDGRDVMVVSNIAGLSTISIARSDGSGVRELDLGMAAYLPTYRPTTGREIAFAGSPGTIRNTLSLGPPLALGTSSDSHGLYVVNADGSDLRTIVAPSPTLDLGLPEWSPDGSHIAYTVWDPSRDETARIHVVAADGSGDRELALGPSTAWQGRAAWSNDGTRLVAFRGHRADDAGLYLAVIPTDGGAIGATSESSIATNGACCARLEWSPDDTRVLVTFMDESYRPVQEVLWDPATGLSLPVPGPGGADPTWQRVAP